MAEDVVALSAAEVHIDGRDLRLRSQRRLSIASSLQEVVKTFMRAMDAEALRQLSNALSLVGTVDSIRSHADVDEIRAGAQAILRSTIHVVQNNDGVFVGRIRHDQFGEDLRACVLEVLMLGREVACVVPSRRILETVRRRPRLFPKSPPSRRRRCWDIQ